ncbi:hypothetical protein ILUMI_07262 [Ignelater luminosus]|uniref:Uncharacterized protein n=1 Tax=Ignelater luminosus TaxID=2038154 RepID=A0A8K0D9M7_IGNLU|nr:hypothetical protein ILUMI_07262 [Ignelater luminosus]
MSDATADQIGKAGERFLVAFYGGNMDTDTLATSYLQNPLQNPNSHFPCCYLHKTLPDIMHFGPIIKSKHEEEETREEFFRLGLAVRENDCEDFDHQTEEIITQEDEDIDDFPSIEEYKDIEAPHEPEISRK